MRQEPQKYRVEKCQQCGAEIRNLKYGPLGKWARKFCNNRCRFRYGQVAEHVQQVIAKSQEE